MGGVNFTMWNKHWSSDDACQLNYQCPQEYWPYGNFQGCGVRREDQCTEVIQHQQEASTCLVEEKATLVVATYARVIKET